MLFVIYCHC